jgi:U32 family peptidase
MTLLKQRQLELLAPAGSLESFFAALESGADAVFCGLKSFSARAKAKNFTLAELECMTGYGHSRGKRVYVALNTLIKEVELSALVDVLAALSQFRVDGLIIQDLGLYHLVHTSFPEIPLHASTQMTIHNIAGVRMLEQMGFARAVLARELNMEEIAHIRNQTTLELEHFVHGALCYSISGHCLFSSYLDGRSGNRGRCIQPCRRRYHHQKQPGFYFSTSDFSAIDCIPQLAEAGVMSLKVEGRMKSAEYVATVVSAYRMVIDALHGNTRDAVLEAKGVLENAMGRKSTEGFLSGRGGVDIVLPKRKGGIGRILGRVERLQGGTVFFRTGDVIHVGDRLRIQPENDRAGQGFTVRKLYLGKKSVKRAGTGKIVSIPLPFRGKVRPGDLVFKLAMGKAFTMSEEACRKRLASVPPIETPVEMTIQCRKGTLFVTASAEGVTANRDYPVEMLSADRSPLTAETLSGVFRRTGHQSLSLAKLHAVDLPPVVIKPSRLKEIRRDFYKHFVEIVSTEKKRKIEERVQKVKEGFLAVTRSRKKCSPERVYLLTDCVEDLKKIMNNRELHLIVPLKPQLLAETKKSRQWSEEDLQRLTWNLPSVVFDEEWQTLQEMVDEALRFGFSRFRLNNLGHRDLFSQTDGIQLLAGPWLYTLNSEAIKTLQNLGIEECCLSLEDDKENIAGLLTGGYLLDLAVTVYSPIDLFTSRIPSSLQRQDASLHSDSGTSFHLHKQYGLTVTRAQEPFSLLGKLSLLRKMGCCTFVVDFTGIGILTPHGQQILKAFNEDLVLPGTSSFNFNRGLA